MVKSLVFCLLIFVTLISINFANSKKAGKAPDMTARKPPDDKIKDLVAQLEPEIREKICEIEDRVCPEDPVVVQAYKKQVVTGTNYFAAVSLRNKYYHVRIYEETWNDVLELGEIIGPKGKKDEIKYF